MPGGRPRIYDDPDELEKTGRAYFEDCRAKDIKPTTAGLAVFLGFDDRRSLYDYAKNERFSHVIKGFIGQIESLHEARMYESGSTGSIFWLKNHGWTDQQSHEITGPGGGNILIQHVCEYVKPNDPSEGGEGSGS